MPDKNGSLPDEPTREDIRCPRLGHQINFSYCRQENNGLPCFKTLDCWYNYFNVHAYLKNKLTPEEFEKTFVKQGSPKLFSLLDLIEQAKKNDAAPTKNPPEKKDKGTQD